MLVYINKTLEKHNMGTGGVAKLRSSGTLSGKTEGDKTRMKVYAVSSMADPVWVWHIIVGDLCFRCPRC